MTFEEALIEHCSPTLAGIKAASLYRFSPQNARQFAQQYRAWQLLFAKRGLDLLILKGCRAMNSYLLYLYRPNALERLLSQPDTLDYLGSLGYDTQAAPRHLLRQLTRRLCLAQDFPHEIGIFLGYPLEDVVGFMQNNGQGYTCCGCWKSYGDPHVARRRFSSYHSCTSLYKQRYADGTPLAQLIVAA